MSNKAKISFVVLSYNHEKYVKLFIESVLAQTEQNFELIIIDDCSLDNNVNQIIKFNDPRIKLVKNLYNKGINRSFSEGCYLAEADIISFLASDDILLPQYSTLILEEFKKTIDVVYCPLEAIDEKVLT